MTKQIVFLTALIISSQAFGLSYEKEDLSASKIFQALGTYVDQPMNQDYMEISCGYHSESFGVEPRITIEVHHGSPYRAFATFRANGVSKETESLHISQEDVEYNFGDPKGREVIFTYSGDKKIVFSVTEYDSVLTVLGETVSSWRYQNEDCYIKRINTSNFE